VSEILSTTETPSHGEICRSSDSILRGYLRFCPQAVTSPGGGLHPHLRLIQQLFSIQISQQASRSCYIQIFPQAAQARQWSPSSMPVSQLRSAPLPCHDELAPGTWNTWRRRPLLTSMSGGMS